MNSESASGGKALRFLWHNARQYKLAIAGIMFCTLISLGFELIRPYFYKDIIDSLSSFEDMNLAVASAMLALFYIFLSFVGHRLFWHLKNYMLVWFEAKVMHNVAFKAFRHVQRLSYAFHNSNFAGSTVRKCNRGIYAMESLIDRVGFDITPLVIQLIAISVIFSIKATPLALALVLGVTTFLAVTIYLNNKQAELESISIKADTRNSGNFHDVVSNIFTVKVFAKERSEDKRHLNFLNDWLKKTHKAWFRHVNTEIWQGLVSLVLEVVILYLSIKFFESGRFTVGDIVFVQSYFISLMGQVWRLGWVYRDFKKAVANADEMIELLETKPLCTNKKNAKKLKFKKGEIEFKNVSFDYGENSNDAVFTNLSLKIKAGEKIALVGPSGSGKTTFVKLLARLIDVTGGEILIDGKNIQDVTIESLRESIGLVPQDPSLFHRPLAENIAYGKSGASKQEIIRASQLAHAHHFIKDLSHGYDTYVGERGVKLSGGERQRVAIARVILENAPIVVFDEATSSLDSISEKHIQAAFHNLMKGRTTIVVAHRLSTIIGMDRILVFEGGKIVEEGKHEELIQKEGSLYKKLWDIQAGGFLPE